jgi:hypothetical protein
VPITSQTTLVAAPSMPQPRFAARRAERVGVLALACLLHVALLSSWEKTMPLALPPLVTHVEIYRLPAAPPEPAPAAERQRPARPPARLQPQSKAAAMNEPTPPRAEADLRPSTPPGSADAPLDIERLRGVARSDERDRVKTPLERLRDGERAQSAPRGIESKVAEAAVRSARKDCQTGYAGYGLFAALPLIYGTVTENGCKWK